MVPFYLLKVMGKAIVLRQGVVSVFEILNIE